MLYFIHRALNGFKLECCVCQITLVALSYFRQLCCIMAGVPVKLYMYISWYLTPGSRRCKIGGSEPQLVLLIGSRLAHSSAFKTNVDYFSSVLRTVISMDFQRLECVHVLIVGASTLLMLLVGFSIGLSEVVAAPA